jgi:O-antigen/teichoic acid export membrane protein
MDSNNKRIAKNTLLLYFRMLFLMLISLYTSRVILNALGVEDYGIYNVVGGIVTMFSLLSGTLSASITRFITYELGAGDGKKLKKIFSCSVTIQIILSIILIILAETVGLWFLNEKIVIPESRMTAANWCYHLSVVTFVINLICIPYNATIIAHEKMTAFAYISILEGFGKLLVAWCIEINPIDRLVFFSFMVAVIAWMVQILYTIYCKHNFEECTYRFIYDKELLKQMFGFAGWNFIGATSGVLRTHGISILINLFFGPSMNAARAIGTKVEASISGFVQNFMTAINPQITKYYANRQFDKMFGLIFKGARFSYYILLFLSLPILFNTHFILVAWLKLVPEHTVLFVQLTLMLAMSDCVSHPLITAMLATGNIRKYQIVVGGLQLMNLPIAYLCLYFGAIPESVMIVAIVISQCALAARLYMLHKMIAIDILYFFKHVYANIFLVTCLSVIIPWAVKANTEESFNTFMIITSLCFLCTLIVELFVGCSQQERELIKKKSIEFIRRFK